MNLVTSILIVATIVGSVWAWRGAAWGVWLAAIARVLAALSVVPLLVIPEAPREAIPTSLVILVLTIVAVVLLFVGLGRRRAA